MKRAICLVLLAACGPHDIVVVELPDGGFQMGGKNCSDSDNCKPDEFCEKASCGATTGVCHHRDNFCMPTLSPTCGCNGVTYWNDCLRRAAGVSASTAGQCASPATCTMAQQCGDPDASCARLLPSSASCSTTPTGVCWVAPRMCPQNDGEAWESCGGAPVCGGLCQAIRSEQVRRPVTSCP